MITRLAHVCFSTHDLAGTIAFYADHFNSKILHEFRNDKNELYGVFLSICEDAEFEFFQIPTPAHNATQFRHVCLEVDNIEESAAYYRGRGFPIEIKRGRTDGTLQFWIEDPNGIKIEFQQYDEKSLLRKK